MAPEGSWNWLTLREQYPLQGALTKVGRQRGYISPGKIPITRAGDVVIAGSFAVLVIGLIIYGTIVAPRLTNLVGGSLIILCAIGLFVAAIVGLIRLVRNWKNINLANAEQALVYAVVYVSDAAGISLQSADELTNLVQHIDPSIGPIQIPWSAMKSIKLSKKQMTIELDGGMIVNMTTSKNVVADARHQLPADRIVDLTRTIRG